MKKKAKVFGVLGGLLLLAFLALSYGPSIIAAAQNIIAQPALADSGSDLENLQRDLQSAQSALATLTDERDALLEDAAGMETALGQAQTDLNMMSGDLEDARGALDETNGRITELEGQLTDLLTQQEARDQGPSLFQGEVAYTEENPLDVDQLYSLETSKLALAPIHARGENVNEPFEVVVGGNAETVIFVAHGLLDTPDEQTIVIPYGGDATPTENVIRLRNTSEESVTFSVTKFPTPGFSVWMYRPGVEALAEELAYVTIGNSTHCGMVAGCSQAVVWDVSYDGTATTSNSVTFTEAIPLEQAIAPVYNIDWLGVPADHAFVTLGKNLSQPQSLIEVTTEEGVLYLGVTYGKDHVVFLPAGATILSPDGQVTTCANPCTAVLENRVEESNTVVYEISGLTAPVRHWEFRVGFEPATAGEFMTRYALDNEDKVALAADVSSMDLVVLTYGAEEPAAVQSFSESLP